MSRRAKDKPLTCPPNGRGWCSGEGVEKCPIHGEPPTLGDERAFLIVLHEIVSAALHTVLRAHAHERHGSLYMAHPWLQVREEVYRRLKAEAGDPRGMFEFSRFSRENETILNNVYKAYEGEIATANKKAKKR